MKFDFSGFMIQMKASKDVGLGQPMTLTIDGDTAMPDAAARRGRIVQVGSHKRSNDSFRKVAELADALITN